MSDAKETRKNKVHLVTEGMAVLEDHLRPRGISGVSVFTSLFKLGGRWLLPARTDRDTKPPTKNWTQRVVGCNP